MEYWCKHVGWELYLLIHIYEARVLLQGAVSRFPYRGRGRYGYGTGTPEIRPRRDSKKWGRWVIWGRLGFFDGDVSGMAEANLETFLALHWNFRRHWRRVVVFWVLIELVKRRRGERGERREERGKIGSRDILKKKELVALMELWLPVVHV